jgi:hypothetical protein
VAETFILTKISLNTDGKKHMIVLEEELGS